MADITTKFLKQMAVYWAPGVPDGYGGATFSEGVEIDCRWADSTEVISDGKGNQMVSKAVVMVAVDLEELGYLYLGTLDDLDSADEDDPVNIDGAFQIKRFDKIPMLKGTPFLRVAYL